MCGQVVAALLSGGPTFINDYVVNEIIHGREEGRNPVPAFRTLLSAGWKFESLHQRHLVLFMSLRFQSVEVLGYVLFESGWDLHIGDITKVSLNGGSSEILTSPLHVACMAGKLQQVAWLIWVGADPHATIDWFKLTPVDYVQYGIVRDPQVLKYLKQFGLTSTPKKLQEINALAPSVSAVSALFQ
jgi:hypothetical protein